MILCVVVAFAASAMAQTASDNRTVDCGSSVTITATPAAGYHFVKWVDGAGAEYTTATLSVPNIKEAKNYTAHFAANQAIDPSIDDPNNPTPNPGDVLQLTPKTNDDCLEFDHWSDLAPGDPNYAANPRPFTYEGVAPTFTAVFKTKTYQVNVTTSTGNTTQGTVIITMP